jgi:hypothetical protein
MASHMAVRRKESVAGLRADPKRVESRESVVIPRRAGLAVRAADRLLACCLNATGAIFTFGAASIIRLFRFVIVCLVYKGTCAFPIETQVLVSRSISLVSRQF